MTELAGVSPHGDAQPAVPVNVVARAGLPWSLIGLAAVALCALPALLLGPRIDTWAASALGSVSATAGAVGLIVGLLALDPVLPVPSSLLATVAGQRMGFASASVAIGAGLFLGNALGYLVGRLAGAPVVERLVGREQLARARARLGSRPGAIALVVTRPVPILSEAALVLAGAAGAPVVRTAAVCGLANAGLAVVYAGLGSAAQGPGALPLALLGAAGVPALALVASALLRPPPPPGPALPEERGPRPP